MASSGVGMAGAPDYYEVLQVHPVAEPEVIQAAYRRLSMKYHPDVYGGADAQRRMAQLNAAYAVLGDAQRRSAYDAQRRSRVAPASPAAGPSLQVTPAAVDMGSVTYGRSRTATIRVRNAGTGKLTGFAVSHVPWLRVSPPEFNGAEQDVSIMFRADRSGEFASARAVEVYSNGGRVVVSVRASVSPEGATPSPSPRRRPPGAHSTLTRRGPMDVGRPGRHGARVPLTAWLVLGTALSSFIWFSIAPVLTVIPLGLGLWLLCGRLGFSVRPEAPSRESPSRGGPALARCGVCGQTLAEGRAAKCGRCGGSVCPSCRTCPCRTRTKR